MNSLMPMSDGQVQSNLKFGCYLFIILSQMDGSTEAIPPTESSNGLLQL